LANIEQIAEELGKLTVLEASQLSKLLQEQWGVFKFLSDNLNKFLAARAQAP